MAFRHVVCLVAGFWAAASGMLWFGAFLIFLAIVI